jgi:hypothetical protein
LAHMSISTYFRPNIHQNGPEILGVKKQTHIVFILVILIRFSSYSLIVLITKQCCKKIRTYISRRVS